MGFFSRFRRSDSGSEDLVGSAAELVADSVEECGFCGATENDKEIHQVDFTTSDRGWIGWACDSCIDEHDIGGGYPSYCCGIIYEEGETVCASCGDPL